MTHRVRAVLFDLDGTLVDSAPDLAATVNRMLALRGRAPAAERALRAVAGSGARGMLRVAFGAAPGEPGYDALRDEFHDSYEASMLERTAVFPAVAPVLTSLDAAPLPWAIVTNKSQRFAEPLTRALGLRQQARALVCGDTTPHTKPHPAPLLEAARRLSVDPAACVYIGDDARDVLAGRAAGMATLVAAWGYGVVDAAGGDLAAAWAADGVLARPSDLLSWLELP